MNQITTYVYIASRYGDKVIVLGSEDNVIFWMYEGENEADDVRVERII